MGERRAYHTIVDERFGTNVPCRSKVSESPSSLFELHNPVLNCNVFVTVFIFSSFQMSELVSVEVFRPEFVGKDPGNFTGISHLWVAPHRLDSWGQRQLQVRIVTVGSCCALVQYIVHTTRSSIPFIRLWAGIVRHMHWRSILLYCILLHIYVRSFTSCYLQVCHRQTPNFWRNDKMQRGFVTTTNDPSTITNQQPNVAWYCSAVDGMIISCSQWFAQLPTILIYMPLTSMHSTCNVHASTETQLFQSNDPASEYPSSSKPYSQLPKPSADNAHTFPSLIVGYRGWWWWTTMGFYFKALDELRGISTRLEWRIKVWGTIIRPQPWGIAVRPQVHQKEGETKRLIHDNHQTFWSLYLFRTLDWQIAQREFAILLD